ncbi:MAG: DUF983 domain-containing protein [Chitinophagaceae bacterium]|nr:DUF983 domain-containing protein [Bacteroidota bacterium]MCC6257572.1 DUF983 domain-containing protein [Chitinophagaceae bacterium]MCW5917997.1 DUF983 domain-containing protein [Ferruginibacter sp.]
MENEKKKDSPPGFLWSMVTMKCPRCRIGNMYRQNNPYRKLSLKSIFDMPEHCPVCRQKYDIEPGFWYGTGYVSYGLAVAISIASFILWVLLIGISTEDNRIFYWLLFNAILLISLQPWLMRLSRAVYIRFFIKYDPDFENNPPKSFN